MVKRYLPKGYTKDTFVNFLAKTGIGTDNISSGGTYGFNPVSRNRTLMEWTYRGSWICGVGVDAIADDMTSEGITLNKVEVDEQEKLNAAWQRLQIWQSLNQVAKWARLYGGALGFIAIKGQDPSTPLRIDTIAKGQFQGITVLDRWMVQPDLTRSVMQPGPEFGNPEYYDVVATSFQFPFPRDRIHYSRLIRMEGVELPFNQKQAENMWGLSVLERLWDRLLAFDSTTQGAAQLAYKAYLRTIKIDGLRKIIATGGKTYEALVAQIEMVRRYQANEGITLLDLKDDFQTQQYTFAGLDGLLEKIGDQVAGALETPQTRLFGQAPGGLNSDGESGSRNYENKIKRTQERWFRRPIDIILRVLAASEEIELPEGWSYDFNSIRQLTDMQKSEVNANNVSAWASAASIPGVKPSTILQEMRQNSRITGHFTNITDKDIEEAKAADAVPSPGEILGTLEPQEGGEGLPGTRRALLPAPKPAPFGLTRGETEDSAIVLDVDDVPCYIETPKGATRAAKDGSWSVVMPAHYGYIEGVGSAEGAFEQLDCYIGPNIDSKRVYVIDQMNLGTGGFDEHKVMLGFDSRKDAIETYKASFHDGHGGDRIMDVTSLNMAQFKLLLGGADWRIALAGRSA